MVPAASLPISHHKEAPAPSHQTVMSTTGNQHTCTSMTYVTDYSVAVLHSLEFTYTQIVNTTCTLC